MGWLHKYLGAPVLDLAKDFLRLLRIRREEFADLVDRAESMAAVQCKDRLRKRIISDVLYPRCAVAAGRKLRDLVFELSLADANEIASSGSALKKNSRTSS